jgi:4-hydroxybenzoate polyprenyltransferase
MAFESWQIIHVLVVLLGLLVGWMFNPWLGTAFILVLVAAIETLSFSIKKRAKIEPKP